MLICAAAAAHGQTMLDQDPAQRAADAKFFAKQPKSSVPGAAPAPSAAPGKAVVTGWLDAHGLTGMYGGSVASRARVGRIAVRYGTWDRARGPATLEVVFLHGQYSLGQASLIIAQRESVTLDGGSPDGSYKEFTPNWVTFEWVVRLLDPSGKVLDVAASEGALADIARSDVEWKSMLVGTQWRQPRAR